MKKKLFIYSTILFIIAISATMALSNSGWRNPRLQLWDKDKLTTLEGKIKDVYGQIVIVESDGKDYITRLGPYWYWQEKGYKIEKDKSIKVTGMIVEVDGKQNIFPQKVVIDNKEIILSDENGIPVWAGHGGRHGKNRQANFRNCRYCVGNPYCWRWRNFNDDAK